MAKRKDSDSPFGEEYEEMIKRSQMMSELGIDESGERIKRAPKVVANKSGNAAKKASTALRKKTAPKKTARLEALKFIKKTGMIPASPTK